MKTKNPWYLRLLLLCFALTISSTVLPGSIITAHGIFGEAASFVAIEKEEAEAFSIRQRSLHKQSKKGTNIFQIWYEAWALVIAMIFVQYVLRLPNRNTVITLKIRMNN